ncbi:MAG: MarR family winged helix-turn-helix transcriptional regulator [Gammaproteobacteria bacterium]
MSSKERGKQSLRAWLRLLACENLIEQHLRTRLRKDFDITLPQFDVLSELEHAGEQLTMSRLSEKLMVSNGNVTGVVDRLERDEYVIRQASPTDRRVQHISLTAKGKKKFQEMAEIHEQWVENLLKDLNLDELDSLLDILYKTRASAARNAKLEQ